MVSRLTLDFFATSVSPPPTLVYLEAHDTDNTEVTVDFLYFTVFREFKQ